VPAARLLDNPSMTWFPRWLKIGSPATLRIQVLALWKLLRHPQTPRAVKWLAFAVVAYAVSPIDLIPDFIPVLGMLDDLFLLPLGVALVIRLTPAALWQECQREAQATNQRLPRLWWGALAVALVWVLLLAWFASWLVKVLAAA
jgi:uncharacterized membrane protein YkvA (DUF1232 family)